MIDLDQFNPDWDFAKSHGKSCKPGLPAWTREEEPNDHTVLCDCCLNIIEKDNVPLCENSKELEFLGFGFPLYFIFLKYCLVFMFILIVSYSCLSIYWAVSNNYEFCVKHVPKASHINGEPYDCTSWMVQFSRTQETVQVMEIILRFTSFIIQLAALVYIRDKIRKTNQYYDERTTSMADYSMIIQNVPKQKELGKKMKRFFREFFEKNHNIQEIIFLNEIDDLYALKDQKTHLIHEKKSLIKDQQKNKEKIAHIDQEIYQKGIIIDQEHEKMLKTIQSDEVLCQKVIVVVSSETDKVAIIQEFQNADRKKLIDYFEGDLKDFNIGEAPQPRQINWHNINYPRQKRIARSLLGWGLSVVFLAIVTVIFFFILQAKGLAIQAALQEYHADPQNSAHLKYRAIIGVYFAILLIILFNKFILAPVLHIFTDLQKHPTGGDLQYSFAMKYTFGLFFTTALMTLLVEDIRFHNIDFHMYGVTEEETVMFFMNSLLVPIIWAVNPWYLMKLLKRWYYYQSKNITQREANKLMEDPSYSMGKRYAEIVECAWFTFLYASLLPIGAFLIFFGYAFFYWIDKYNLLRKSCVMQNVSGGMSMKAMRLLDVTLVLRAAGEMIFDSQIRDGVSYQSIVCICIGFVFCILPKDEILDFFHDQKFKVEEKPYEEVKNRFIENYTTLHPLFQKQRNAIITSMTLVGRTIKFTTEILNAAGTRALLNQTGAKLFQSHQTLPIGTIPNETLPNELAQNITHHIPENILMIKPKKSKLQPLKPK